MLEQVGHALDRDQPPVANDRRRGRRRARPRRARARRGRPCARARVPRPTRARNSSCMSGSSPVVGSSRISSSGRVEERLDQPDLLAVAARELSQRAVEVGAEAPRQFVGAAERADPAKSREQRERLAPGRVLAVAEVAGQVAEAGADRDAVATAVEAEDARAARGSGAAGRAASGSSSSSRRRWDPGSRIPRPRSTARRDVLDAAVPAVALRQAVGLDGRHGSHGFTSAAGFRLRTPIAMTGTPASTAGAAERRPRRGDRSPAAAPSREARQ